MDILGRANDFLALSPLDKAICLALPLRPKQLTDAIRNDAGPLIEYLIERITPTRHRDVFKLRYGFTDGKFHTYPDMSAHVPWLDISPQRIRQIDQAAIRKLGHMYKNVGRS